MKELRDALDSCDDGCPNGHYSVRDLDGVCVGQFGSVERLGHPLVCSNDGGVYEQASHTKGSIHPLP